MELPPANVAPERGFNSTLVRLRPFQIALGQVTSPTPVTITATLNGVSTSATFTVLPAALKSLQFNPAAVSGGSQAFAWDGSVLRCDATGIVLRAPFNVDQVDLGFTTFRRGDEFIEFYFWHRWFNVFQISTPDGTLKGWYSNLGLPVELDPETGDLKYVDLALDVWTAPTGEHLVLDQEEFDALMAEHGELAENAEHGRKELLELVKTGRLPRWPE